MKLYKLTESDNTTYNGAMEWEIGKTNFVKECKNPQLCSSDVIHAYENLNLALILNPVHADISNFNIYACEGNIAVKDYGKCGVFALTPTKKIKTPQWYEDKKTRKKVLVLFAIYCAESVIKYFEIYDANDKRPHEAIAAARDYLKNGVADTADYAYAAAAACVDAYAAACVDAYAAAYAAAYAIAADADADAIAADADADAASAYDTRAASAYASIRAAASAAYTADAAAAYAAARTAVYANTAAYAAARTAVYANTAAYAAADEISFSKIANKAVKLKGII